MINHESLLLIVIVCYTNALNLDLPVVVVVVAVAELVPRKREGEKIQSSTCWKNNSLVVTVLLVLNPLLVDTFEPKDRCYACLTMMKCRLNKRTQCG